MTFRINFEFYLEMKKITISKFNQKKNEIWVGFPNSARNFIEQEKIVKKRLQGFILDIQKFEVLSSLG